ncbi:MAG TPA: serine/threonine-protein kinase PknK, partial [Polyangiaceae bacterium]
HALAGAWLAKQSEDAATVAKHLELGGRGSEAAIHWERAARRALSINALSDAVRMAETALLHADDQPTAFARALLLDEGYSRLDPRAADRETAVQALAGAAYDEATTVRAEGARVRFDHARGVGYDVQARLASVRAGAKRLGLVDEEMRCTAILAMSAAFEGHLQAAEREAEYLFPMSRDPKLAAAAVDAWQCLAVVRQTKGELVSALEARRAAAMAASQAGLKERESMLNVNLGFALTTIGARSEAREAILSGLAIAEAIGSVGAIRHGRMNLLGWTATFGPDASLDAELAEIRAEADQATGGVWVAPDRATLGVLFYRGLEWLSMDGPAAATRARDLLRAAAGAYRSTGNRDLLPVALGNWSAAERRVGSLEQARTLAEEAASLLENGAPSLLNESAIFLALHDSLADADIKRSADAVRRGMAPLLRRLRGLAGSSYAVTFLTALSDNEKLLRLAHQLGLVPAEVPAALAARSPRPA